MNGFDGRVLGDITMGFEKSPTGLTGELFEFLCDFSSVRIRTQKKGKQKKQRKRKRKKRKKQNRKRRRI
jgi:hypothetical protein